MADRTYVFRLVGDFGTVTPGAEAAARSVDKLGDAQDGFARRTAAASTTTDRFATKSLAAMANGTKLTRQEVLALNYTMSDVAASLASGASPFTILLQQGGQVRDSFGGFGPLFSKLGGLITPTRLAVGGLATAFVALGVAAALGYGENVKFERSLLTTGNRAGTTASEMDALTASISRNTNTTARSTREALQAVVASGQFGPEVLAQVATAVQLISKRTGQSADEVVKDLSRMTGGVAKYAAEQNKSLNLITAAQYKYLQSLEAQGRTEEAQLEYLRILSERMGKQLPSDLGYVERAWNGVRNAASSAWDAMLNLGKPDTLAQQLENVRAQLEQEQERLAFARDGRGSKTEIAGREAAVEALRVRIETLREGQRAEERAAQNAGELAGRSNKEIAALAQGRVDAVLGLERSGFARQQALAEVARATESAALEQQYQRQEVTQERYVERRYALEKAAIDAQAALINRELSFEQRRSAGSPEETAQKTARTLDLQTRRIALGKEYLALQTKLANGELAGASRNLREGAVSDPTAGVAFRLAELGQVVDQAEGAARTAFRQGELAQTQATEAAYRERGVAAKQAAAELLQGNRALNIALIRDDRERGLAVIAAEEDQLRRRLDLDALVGAERKAAEDSLANYVVLRNQQLTEELKPEWQRMLDAWADTTGQMKRYGDEFMSGFLRTGQQTWQDWAVSGKLSTRGLTDFIKSEFARLVYEQYLAQHTASLGKTILNGLIGGLGALTGGRTGSDPNGYNGTQNNPSAYVAPKLATGTNYVPYDGFKAELHEGEAVVPKKYNPAAGGQAGGGINLTQQISVGAGVSRAEVFAAVKMANEAMFARIVRSRTHDGAMA